ncbi:MAG TPA: hypothetical protein DEP32_10090 [Pseudomonas sp.]|nr:hypothetical protein [Pseudomonas sp.]MBB50912.1 hypothetical protein [Pseudomonadales bacterium]MBF76791.1 hypothetical protein [Pseudomonadales bacterium]MBU30825.1 hypothetical protein [Pseudomonadales bacterium]HCA24502.1 hypothetical protein [Pseudomonas sp.]|tara:strand:+ start:1028 stop:1357 length:330 start_codon:yes stop_codon:yes gene_type:complete
MKKAAAITLVLFSITASAEDKTALAHAAEAMEPAVKAYTDYIEKSVLQTFAGNDSPMGEAARSQLRSRERAEMEANRGPMRSVRECMKPNNVIDQDVQECAQGLRQKTW